MPSRFEDGVRYYTAGIATLTLFFPETDVCCANCRLLCNDYGLKRARCAYTGEIIADPEFYTGKDCPIEFERKES